MRNLWADVRHAVRTLAASPGFTLAAVIALALGIGANTAIFSIIDRILLRPLPYRESERILRIQRQIPNFDGSSVSIPKFMAWRQSRSFESMAAYDQGTFIMNFGTSEGVNPVSATHVSAGFFDVFGAKPMLGRTFSAQEDLPGAGRFAILTYDIWKNSLGANRGIVGKSVILNAEPYRVLGVLAEGYRRDPPADIFLPEQFDPNSTNLGHSYLIAGRLSPGASVQSAAAEMKVIGDRFRVVHPDAVDRNESIGVTPLRVAIGGKIRPALIVLAAAVVFVLIMACANVASLLLARSVGRHREIAVRTALGASRGRIASHLLTESLLLALAGGVGGLVLAAAGVRLLLAFSPGNIPRITGPGHPLDIAAILDWRLAVFLLAVSLLTGAMFGLFPALRLSRPDLNAALKEAAGRSGTGLRHNRVRGTLVVTEIALAVVLLAGATLMLRSFARLRGVKPGFNPAGVLTMSTSISGNSFSTTAQVESLVRQASERIEALPGIRFAAVSMVLPTTGVLVDLPFSIEGRPPKIAAKWEGNEQWRFISPHYFDALGIPLIRGREFDPNDSAHSARVVILNEALAKKHWPGEDPVGRRIVIGRGIGAMFEEPAREVVGIVGSVAETGLNKGVVPVMYVPQAQMTDALTKFSANVLPLRWVIRAERAPGSHAAAVERELRNLDARLSPSSVLTMNQVISWSTSQQSFDTLLLNAFALIALLLASVGIYGLMSYTVEQRTQELGIRMALGAGFGSMLRLILGQGLRLTALGIALGLAGAYAATRSLAGLLFGVRTTDPLTFAAVVITLAAISAAAVLIPALRATRVDPLVALRHD